MLVTCAQWEAKAGSGATHRLFTPATACADAGTPSANAAARAAACLGATRIERCHLLRAQTSGRRGVRAVVRDQVEAPLHVPDADRPHHRDRARERHVLLPGGREIDRGREP